MKKIILSFLVVCTTIATISYSYAMTPVDAYPICEKNTSGSILCASFSGQIVPEDKLVLIKDFCPEGDGSSIVFDKTCQYMSGSEFVKNASGLILIPFGKVEKYLKLTQPLEDASFYPKDEENTELNAITTKFFVTGAGDDSSLMVVVMVLGAIISYFSLGFVVFKK